jgi:hypothetical protein
MNSHHRIPSALRSLASIGTLVAVLSSAFAVSTRAQCPPSLLHIADPNIGYPLTAPYLYQQFNVATPYWIAFGAVAADSNADYDVSLYQRENVFGACPAPACMCQYINSSSYSAGRTDFVIGDFNHNAYAPYWTWIHCFSGSCLFAAAGQETWGTNGLLSVDSEPITVNTSASAVDGSQVLRVYDVFLSSGTTYSFCFQKTGDRESKLCLFGNLAQGTYWGGRRDAQFETDQRVTQYTAPVTGYYGVVVVQDRLTGNPGSFTLGISTSIPCHCPTVLANEVPQLVPASPAEVRDVAIQSHTFWAAVGVRSSADWDLGVGNTPSSPPDLGCPTDLLNYSILLPPSVDVLAGDYNWSFSGDPRDTVAVRVTCSSGSAPATVQLEGTEAPTVIQDNAGKKSGTLYADDVLRVWDVLLQKDTTYTFSLQTCCASQKLLLFGNPSHALSWQARANAYLETSSTATFKPGFLGYYAAVVIKEDANIGGYSLGFGHCASATPLATRTPYSSFTTTYCAFDQPADRWGAIGVWGTLDWDIRQYDLGSGSAWPDCFGSPGALSAGNSGMDFIVGDFHHNPPGTQYARTYQYTSNAFEYGLSEWDSGSGELFVNGAPTTITLDAQNEHHLWCYEVYLASGVPYTFEFSRVGTADTHLLLFANPTNGVYWAPRSAAMFSTTTNMPFTAPQSGAYAVVVARDNADQGRFTLRVSSSALDAGNSVRPAHDALTALTPNPARGPLRVGFDLTAAAEPAFELLDTQGRVLNRWSRGAFATGHWDVTMPAADDRGRALAPGLYFVRMRLGQRTVDTRKLAIAP